LVELKLCQLMTYRGMKTTDFVWNMQVTGTALEVTSTSATTTQEKRALAGMLSRSKSPSLRRSMLCTLPRMERAMSEDLQVCGLHSQMYVCLYTCTDCTIAFPDLAFGCIVYNTDVYLFVYTLHCDKSACQTM